MKPDTLPAPDRSRGLRPSRQPQRWRRVLRRIALAFAALLLLFCILPYLIPVSSAEPQLAPPFGNSAFRTVNGAQLHYRIWPATTAAIPAGKVLLIHGLGGSTVSWSENVAALQAQGFWTVAADLPGFGYSTRQTGLDHSQANRARLLWELLATLDGEAPAALRSEPWRLVGHSMGGGTIVAMALSKPDHTASLVLVDGAVFENASGPGGALFRFPPAARWLQVLLERVLITPERIAGILASAAGQTVPAGRVDAYYRALTVPGSARAFIDIVQTVRNEPAAGLASLRMPVRAIWGGADTWVPAAQAGQLRAIVPRLELQVIADAGHLPMETHPTDFNLLLTDMLRRP